ncbi:MAG: hypothetical protein HOM68_15400 [Gemmatimonadetes bacterium]|jgi:hypothetical protein|nr:hypothetical protein [Gemmatimonadota bacterium]MBT5057928.1 hypothetical protein [Gemmatimonadota bacterium]MBT5144368.1 hypothetical protein [Gemmatimonadota bacterium]MBT5587114.1 hypothetical protein [Gemmatimonadota bacterium]MBT5960382.1 hypothetical protein [Gemmatimonadota bacterium]
MATIAHSREHLMDLLSTDRVRMIAHYPIDVMLSPGRYFAYSDCDERVALEAGLVTRLIERTGVEELRGALAEPAGISMGLSRFHTAWRNMLWWDGTRPDPPQLQDAWLRQSAVVRLVSKTDAGAEVVLAAKTGHNGVSHNHNDVGHFVIHADGETLLCDPEKGLYDLYRRHGHDANLFANSIGHSVPKIGDTPQSKGAEFGGKILTCDTTDDKKRIAMDMAGAYHGVSLESLQRTLTLNGGDIVFEDRFDFSAEDQPVEEAFVTWLEPVIDAATARISGARHQLELEILEPAGATWSVQAFAEESLANNKKETLKRLTFTLAAGTNAAKVRLRVSELAPEERANA